MLIPIIFIPKQLNIYKIMEINKRRSNHINKLAICFIILFTLLPGCQLTSSQQMGNLQQQKQEVLINPQPQSPLRQVGTSNLMVVDGSLIQKNVVPSKNFNLNRNFQENQRDNNLPMKVTLQAEKNKNDQSSQLLRNGHNSLDETIKQSEEKDLIRLPSQIKKLSPYAKEIQKVQRWRHLVQQDLNSISKIGYQEIQYYEMKYDIDQTKQTPFCIVVPTYNNAEGERYLKNMKSIVMQNYSNFHIVVFDDASTDKTGDLIQEFLESQTKVPKERYHIERNEQQMRAMYNLRRAALEFCKPQEVFLIVDGDDELLGRQVLKLFSASFQKEQVWFVYSNFLMSKGSKVGYSRPLPSRIINNNSYRTYPFVISHLRAFYTKLFVNIRDEDLRDEYGQYFKAANDVAICIPCLQQSHRRVRFIPEMTYVYNSDTGQNNHVIRHAEQRSNDRKIRKYPRYLALDRLF